MTEIIGVRTGAEDHWPRIIIAGSVYWGESTACVLGMLESWGMWYQEQLSSGVSAVALERVERDPWASGLVVVVRQDQAGPGRTRQDQTGGGGCWKVGVHFLRLR